MSEVLERRACYGRQNRSNLSALVAGNRGYASDFRSVCFVGPNPSNGENNAIEGRKERTEVRPCLELSAYLTVMVTGVEWLSAPDVPVTVKVT